MTVISNVLATRYASKAIKDIFSEEGKVLLEREFWIAVMKAQAELGLDIPSEAIEAYENVKNQINMTSIYSRERTLRHDVKARIEEFCDLAGFEHIHKGMTSRDLTDNVEQYQILKALRVISLKTVKSLSMLSQKSIEWKSLLIAGRTHNVAAQPTTWGKRLAMFGQDFLFAFNRLESLIERYTIRGLKGAVGTVLDQSTLFGDVSKTQALEKSLAKHLGFRQIAFAVGQVYPRSLDFEVISALHQLGGGPSSLAKTLRLMAGHELACEGFKKGQVGSSAMPHKMNSRNCERLNGFHTILSGYVTMTGSLTGDQWNEGDVSCSVVRRVALPDSFFAIDGLLETFLTILQEMEVYESVIKKELDHYLPFLATTTLLMAAVKKGLGREQGHEILKKCATESIEGLRQGGETENKMLQLLSLDEQFPLSLEEMQEILKDTPAFIGQATAQVDQFATSVGELNKRYPAARSIEPGNLL